MRTLASGSIDLKSLKVAGEEATSYITKIDGGGIKVHDAGDEDNYIQLTSNGMDIYKDINSTPTCVAQFRDEIIIGEERKSYVRITDDGYYINTKGLIPFKVEYEDMTYNEETFEIGYQLTYENMSTATGQSITINELDIVVPFSDFTLYATYVVRNMEISGHTSATFTKGIEKEVEQTNLGCTLTLSYDGDKTFIFKMVYVGDPLDELPIDATLDRFVWEKLSSFPVMQVGIDGNSHLRVDYHSLQLIDKDDNTYFHISDLRNSNGYATIVEHFIGTGSQTIFSMQFPCKDFTHHVTINGQEISADNIDESLMAIRFIDVVPSSGAKIAVSYETNSSNTKLFTIGTRLNSSTNGGYSTTIGNRNSATAFCSYAEGDMSEAHGAVSHAENSSYAEGEYSHSEGYDTHAKGDYSHSEGYSSVADKKTPGAVTTYTAIDGIAAHAEGYESIAIGDYSHAQNWGTYARGRAQTTIGRFNKKDEDGTGGLDGGYSFIIGNGTADDARSNALTVDWNGNIMSQGMAGQIIMYAGPTAPTGWLLCDGSAVSRNTYATLFAVIGTTYGAGDGSTTFNLPDFRDRFAVGAGSTYSNNSQGGYKDAAVISHTHSISSSGGHTHTVTAKYDQDIKVESGGGTRYKATGNSTSTSMATIANDTGKHTHSVPAPTGAVAGTDRNLPPYIGINFIIATGKTY